MKRASQMGFLLCFLGILAAVPLLIALRGADNQTSYYENRTLAAMRAEEASIEEAAAQG